MAASQDYLFTIIDNMLADTIEKGRENANAVRSLSLMEHVVVSEVCKNYLFERVYKDLPIIKVLHNQGFIYHHQTGRLSPYCIGLTSYDLARKGLASNATNERSAKPPKRIDVLLSQASNLICLLSQEVSGATSLNDLSTVVAGYLYHIETALGKKIDDYDLVNYWHSFLYNVNIPFRSGNSPFSNLTLDFAKPNASLAGKTVVYAGQYLDYSYKDIPTEYFDRVNKAFIDSMLQGDSLGNPFTFPLITVNITDDFDYSNPVWNYFLENSDKFGGFYLQNYCTKPFTEESRKINPYHIPYDIGMLYSNCCRMTFNIKDLISISGCNPFANASGVGGIGVININLNRLLWLSQKNMDLFFRMLSNILDLSGEALETKRKFLRSIWKDMFPYLSFYVPDDKNLFSILSVIGCHEGLISSGIANGIYSDEGKQIAHNIGRYLREYADKLTTKYGSIFNVEFAPSETAAVRLAEKDLVWCDKLNSGNLDLVYEILNTKGGEELGKLILEAVKD